MRSDGGVFHPLKSRGHQAAGPLHVPRWRVSGPIQSQAVQLQLDTAGPRPWKRTGANSSLFRLCAAGGHANLVQTQLVRLQVKWI